MIGYGDAIAKIEHNYNYVKIKNNILLYSFNFSLPYLDVLIYSTTSSQGLSFKYYTLILDY